MISQLLYFTITLPLRAIYFPFAYPLFLIEQYCKKGNTSIKAYFTIPTFPQDNTKALTTFLLKLNVISVCPLQLRSHNIELIKQYRAQNGCDVKTAKKALGLT